MMNLIFKIGLILGLGTAPALAVENVEIQNVLQIPPGLQDITNVSSREDNILNYYMERRQSFPKAGVLIEVTQPFLTSLVSYSGLYCEKMIQRDAVLAAHQRWAHQSILFDKPPQQWTQASIDAQLHQYAEMFWQRDLTAEEYALMNDLTHQLSTDLPNKLESDTLLLMSVCAVFGSSFSFLSLQ
jgi:hypothetical protein